MANLDAIRGGLPELARDIKLNLQAVLQAGDALSNAQRWGVAIASAATLRHPPLLDAVLADASADLGPAQVEDALAAATLMAMNNVFYRFRHLVGNDAYARIPARLRMNRMVKPAADKLDFELYCLAASAVAGCETCIRAHEHAVIEGGLAQQAVHDAIRIAATLAATALAMQLPEPAARPGAASRAPAIVSGPGMPL